MGLRCGGAGEGEGLQALCARAGGVGLDRERGDGAQGRNGGGVM